MTDKLIELELRLMVIRHGRERVLASLSRLGSQSVDDLEREIATLAEQRVSGRKKRANRSAVELLEEATRDCPEAQALMATLVNRFENRTFLPQLRDVVRFLDGIGVPHGKLKSRAASLPKVVTALAGCSSDELRQLAAHSPADSDNDYMMLAREIMAGGRPRRPQKDKPE